MPEAPAVLLSNPMLHRMEATLAAEGWRPVKAWEMADADRAEVRAILHAGEAPLKPAFLESLPKLGLVAVVSVGYNGVDVPWCRARGIEVTHCPPGGNADDVADHAIGLLIAGWRDIVAGDQMIREGRWASLGQSPARPSLNSRKLGVVGLGAIGAAAARRAEVFGMQVSWWGPRAKPADWPRADTLLQLAADSDILLVACRADESNRGLVSREVIEAVGPRGLIVNVARGSVIDEEELIAALKDRRLGRAALDVFEREPTPAERWRDVPYTVVTPHVAGGTVEVVPRMLALAVDNIRLFLGGQPVLSPVEA